MGEPSTSQDVIDHTADNNHDTTESSEPVAAVKKCAVCSKVEQDPEKPLKACLKCHSVLYCSKDCQKADFKQHKKTCASLAQIYAQNNAPSRAVTRAPPKPSAGSRGLQKWQFDT